MTTKEHVPPVLRDIHVKVMSEDRSVRARLTPEKGPVVEIRPDSLKGRSEHQLSRQLELVLNGMLAGYRKAVAAAVRLHYGEPPDEAEGGLDRLPLNARLAVERRERARSLGRELKVTVTSPARCVHLTLNGERIAVALSKGVVAEHPRTVLVSEVNWALRDLMSAYRHKAEQISDEVYIRTSDSELRKAIDERR